MNKFVFKLILVLTVLIHGSTSLSCYYCYYIEGRPDLSNPGCENTTNIPLEYLQDCKDVPVKTIIKEHGGSASSLKKEDPPRVCIYATATIRSDGNGTAVIRGCDSGSAEDDGICLFDEGPNFIEFPWEDFIIYNIDYCYCIQNGCNTMLPNKTIEIGT